MISDMLKRRREIVKTKKNRKNRRENKYKFKIILIRI